MLTEEEKFFIDLPELTSDKEFFKKRSEAFDILQNRDVVVFDRLKNLADRYGYKFDFSNRELYNFYMSLERLDTKWENELEKLKETNCERMLSREDLQIFFEQLACYFIFRHFENGVAFTLISCWVLGAICSKCDTREQMIDVVRMYSSEIEYSEENLEKVNNLM